MPSARAGKIQAPRLFQRVMSLRLFAALALPAPIAEQVLELQKGMRGIDWRPRENLHLTLRFFGELSLEEIAQKTRLVRALRDAYHLPGMVILQFAFSGPPAGAGSRSRGRRASGVWGSGL